MSPKKDSFDPVELDPDKFKVLFENQRVRAIEGNIGPGQKHAMHSHPSQVIYPLASYKLRYTYPDGTTKIAQRKAGEVVWAEGSTHAAENIGTVEIHTIIIELKSDEERNPLDSGALRFAVAPFGDFPRESS